MTMKGVKRIWTVARSPSITLKQIRVVSQSVRKRRAKVDGGNSREERKMKIQPAQEREKKMVLARRKSARIWI